MAEFTSPRMTPTGPRNGRARDNEAARAGQNSGGGIDQAEHGEE
jgi:hypothetical protein